MADFCRQCHGQTFGAVPYNDLDGLCSPDHMSQVICEGCGHTFVNDKGECIYDACLEAKAGRPHHAEADAKWRNKKIDATENMP